jgi:predicted HTH transcriptional regulator
MGAKIKGLYREDVYELPPEALRETVTNAVMHRNYLSHAFIQISIYDDRVEIYSPGKLVAPQSLDKMMSGLSYLRNPLLADMFQQMRMAEHWGTGIQRVREACLENGVEPPAYTCDDMGVMVIYQRPDLNLERTPIRHHGTKNAYMGEYKELLAYIAGQGKVSVAEVMNFLSCSRSTAMRTISAMLSGNLIVKEGVHKNVRYVVAEHISKSLT